MTAATTNKPIHVSLIPDSLAGLPNNLLIRAPNCGDLEREGFAMFERGTAVEADTRDAGNFEFDCQHISLLAEWVVTGCTVDGTHRAVGKGLGIKASSGLGIFIVPETNRVLCHCMSFRFHGGPISGYAAFLKSPICASNARLKAGREVQRSTYAARRFSLVTMSVCFRIRSTVVIIKSPAVKRSPSR